ncbi:MFS transporter [Nocardia arthritidis]|uniref:MFS transporter n=1 Tax=Nocardia arthritidis TaxID=228602 RepID=A0A6G9Y746_9NOCA|nr:MFS transporter [Nocardia arthritidis]QIS08896.1 MFS transporter [Nocardia arthritidis]
MRSYREVLAVAAARNVLLLGALVRIPYFAGSILLPVHVVQTLHGSYAQAGLLATALTVCRAASGPWRGRLLDRLGLRRTILPSIVIGGLCWAVAPFVGYGALLGIAALAGLFEVPIFTVVRQAVIAVTTEQARKSALALESVSIEAAFMIGPVIGIAATGAGSTRVVLFVIQMCLVLAGLLLWALNPPLRSNDSVDSAAIVPRRAWFGTEFVALCLGACAAVAVLGATELAFVPAIRAFDAQRWLGVVLALWGFGSLLGGLVYGALHRPISTYILLAWLGIVTVPMVFVNDTLTLALTGLLAGVFCAPTLTASVDQLSRIVPEGGRGEAMGWHGATMTLGQGIGSSMAGVVIDAGGYRAGFGGAAIVGIVCGVGLALIVALVHRGRVRAARVREVAVR